jgi:hypothetical protein
MNYPEPIYILEKIEDSKSRYTQELQDGYVSTPYRELGVFGKVKDLKIFTPFDKIIEKDMGHSHCPECGAKYSGTQTYCSSKIKWVSLKESQFYESWHRANQVEIKGSNATFVEYKRKESKLIVDAKISSCGGRLVWDLQSQFDEQKSFFDFVDFVSSIPAEGNQPLIEKYANLIGRDRASQMRIAYLEQQLVRLQVNNDVMRNSIAEIRSKMNQAGMSLSF